MFKRKVITAGVFLCIFILTGCAERPDLNFCRQNFARFINGSLSVEKRIDWNNFQAVGINVGETYQKITGKKNREGYKRALIKAVGVSFSKAGGDFGLFYNWRVFQEDNARIISVAEYKKTKKTIYVTVSKSRPAQLVSIQWDKP